MEYHVKIALQIQEMFNPECENHVSVEELTEGDNATDFLHALANTVPASVYNKLTNNDLGTLDFNHIANKLCFQNSELIK